MRLDEDYELTIVVADADRADPGEPAVYGDICRDVDELHRYRPGCKPVFGFCLTDRRGIIPANCADWHDTPGEAYDEYLRIKASRPAKLDVPTLLPEIAKRAKCQIVTHDDGSYGVVVSSKADGHVIHELSGQDLTVLLAEALVRLDMPGRGQD